jgi:hypothetical protein
MTADTTATATEKTIYDDEEWEEAVSRVREADAAVLAAREAKRRADIVYGNALAAQSAAQKARDMMIVGDSRTSAEVSRHAGVTRTRCSQIRSAAGLGKPLDLPADSRRLLGIVTGRGEAA